jgi:hypothetical protein
MLPFGPWILLVDSGHLKAYFSKMPLDIAYPIIPSKSRGFQDSHSLDGNFFYPRRYLLVWTLMENIFYPDS